MRLVIASLRGGCANTHKHTHIHKHIHTNVHIQKGYLIADLPIGMSSIIRQSQHTNTHTHTHTQTDKTNKIIFQKLRISRSGWLTCGYNMCRNSKMLDELYHVVDLLYTYP